MQHSDTPPFPVHVRGVYKWIHLCVCVSFGLHNVPFGTYALNNPGGRGQVFTFASVGCWNVVVVRMLHWDSSELSSRNKTTVNWRAIKRECTGVPFPFLRVFSGHNRYMWNWLNDTRKCISVQSTSYTVRVMLHIFVIRKKLATYWDGKDR